MSNSAQVMRNQRNEPLLVAGNANNDAENPQVVLKFPHGVPSVSLRLVTLLLHILGRIPVYGLEPYGVPSVTIGLGLVTTFHCIIRESARLGRQCERHSWRESCFIVYLYIRLNNND